MSGFILVAIVLLTAVSDHHQVDAGDQRIGRYSIFEFVEVE